MNVRFISTRLGRPQAMRRLTNKWRWMLLVWALMTLPSCAALQSRSLRPAELVAIRVIDMDADGITACLRIRLDRRPASAACVGLVFGTARIGGGQALPIPRQQACPRGRGAQGWLDINVAVPRGSLDESAVKAILAGRPHVEVHLKAAEGLGSLAPTHHFAQSVPVRFPLALQIAPQAAQAWIRLGALRFDMSSLTGISVQTDIIVRNPTGARGRLTITDAALHVGELLLASGGRGRTSIGPMGYSDATVRFGVATLGAFLGLTRLAYKRQITVCATSRVQLQVATTVRRFEVRACRVVAADEFFAAVARGVLP